MDAAGEVGGGGEEGEEEGEQKEHEARSDFNRRRESACAPPGIDSVAPVLEPF